MNIKGLSDIDRLLNSDFNSEVEDVLKGWAQEVISKASSRAITQVRNDFGYDISLTENGYVVTLKNTNILGAYSEFGTGGQVFDSSLYNFSKEDKEYAYNFFKTGKGTLKATPALYPSYFEKRNQLAIKLADAINKVFM